MFWFSDNLNIPFQENVQLFLQELEEYDTRWAIIVSTQLPINRKLRVFIKESTAKMAGNNPNFDQQHYQHLGTRYYTHTYKSPPTL